MDADGNVLANHEGQRSLAAFEATAAKAREFLDLKAKAEAGDRPSQIEVLRKQIDLRHFGADEAKKRVEAIGDLDDATGKDFADRIVPLKVYEILSTVTVDKATRIAAGKRYDEMRRRGEAPSGDREFQHLWMFIFEYAGSVPDVKLYVEGVAAAEARWGTNARYARWIDQAKQKLDVLKGRDYQVPGRLSCPAPGTGTEKPSFLWSSLASGSRNAIKGTFPNMTAYPDLAPPRRTLLGPGPSEAHPRVLRALATPLVGYFDPYFLAIMDRVQQMLRRVFQTQNPVTFPISGTGNLGMEAAFANLIEPGDTAVIGVNGVFGGRMAENVERHGGRVVVVEAPWGEIVPPDRMAQAIRDTRPKVAGIVHAETSTGVCQPIEEVAAAVRETGALLVVDCVTSLSGVPLPVDALGIDVAHSGSQKCLNCPPGLAPITFSERAMQAVRARRTKVTGYPVDVALLAQHWAEASPQRTYHHTPPTSMVFALYEALRIVLDEGLEARFARHKLNSEALVAGLEAMGLRMASQEGHRLWTLNTVRVPEGIDEAKVRAHLLFEHSIEIGAGLGQFKGKIWRIGLMGRGSSHNNVLAVLGALDQALGEQGFTTAGSGVEAALEVYRRR